MLWPRWRPPAGSPRVRRKPAPGGPRRPVASRRGRSGSRWPPPGRRRGAAGRPGGSGTGPGRRRRIPGRRCRAPRRSPHHRRGRWRCRAARPRPVRCSAALPPRPAGRRPPRLRRWRPVRQPNGCSRRCPLPRPGRGRRAPGGWGAAGSCAHARSGSGWASRRCGQPARPNRWSGRWRPAGSLRSGPRTRRASAGRSPVRRSVAAMPVVHRPADRADQVPPRATRPFWWSPAVGSTSKRTRWVWRSMTLRMEWSCRATESS